MALDLSIEERFDEHVVSIWGTTLEREAEVENLERKRTLQTPWLEKPCYLLKSEALQSSTSARTIAAGSAALLDWQSSNEGRQYIQ